MLNVTKKNEKNVLIKKIFMQKCMRVDASIATAIVIFI